MQHETFEAFCRAMESTDDVTVVRRATAFWSRLGDVEAQEMALESVALAKALESNPAGVCMEEAKDYGYSKSQILDAALYATRS